MNSEKIECWWNLLQHDRTTLSLHSWPNGKKSHGGSVETDISVVRVSYEIGKMSQVEEQDFTVAMDETFGPRDKDGVLWLPRGTYHSNGGTAVFRRELSGRGWFRTVRLDCSRWVHILDTGVLADLMQRAWGETC